MKVTVIKVIMPWWLKWAKRFVVLESDVHYLPCTLRGQKIDMVIIDEVI